MELLKKNEGQIERIARIIIGLIVLSLVFVGPKTMFGLLGLIPLVTGAIGTCPIYSVLGLSTCKNCEVEEV